MAREKNRQEEIANQRERDRTARMRKRKRVEKPFKAESRRLGECLHPGMAFLFEWHGYKRFETREEADKWVAKELRSKPEFMQGKVEYRIIDTRDARETQ